jgi:hypothetical protein
VCVCLVVTNWRIATGTVNLYLSIASQGIPISLSLRVLCTFSPFLLWHAGKGFVTEKCDLFRRWERRNENGAELAFWAWSIFHQTGETEGGGKRIGVGGDRREVYEAKHWSDDASFTHTHTHNTRVMKNIFWRLQEIDSWLLLFLIISSRGVAGNCWRTIQHSVLLRIKVTKLLILFLFFIFLKRLSWKIFWADGFYVFDRGECYDRIDPNWMAAWLVNVTTHDFTYNLMVKSLQQGDGKYAKSSFSLTLWPYCVSVCEFFFSRSSAGISFFLGGGRELGVCGVEALDGPRLWHIPIQFPEPPRLRRLRSRREE